MENTIENKRVFSAQYYGQNVLFVHQEFDYYKRFEVDLLVSKIKESDYLELKPLSQITDEDALIIADILKLGYTSKSNQIKCIKNWLADKDNLNSSCSFKWNELQAFDKLKELGYALPYLGLSVEKQIEYGWVKLKEN